MGGKEPHYILIFQAFTVACESTSHCNMKIFVNELSSFRKFPLKYPFQENISVYPSPFLRIFVAQPLD